MKKLIAILLFFPMLGLGQRISGNFSQLVQQEIRLEGFDGLNTYPIAKIQTDDKGNFALAYTNQDFGIGYLISAEDKPLFVVLSGEDVTIVGESLSFAETIKVQQGKENLLFQQYAFEHPKREQALSAWIYLQNMYKADALFSVQPKTIQAIQTEIARIKKEDDTFLNNLPKNTYVSWYLPMRKLLSSVSVVAQYRTNEIKPTIEQLRKIDFNDKRLYKSGLFKEAIDNHYWLLENSGKSLDSVFVEMSISINHLVDNLAGNDKMLNVVTEYLFDLLERHSLFKASEYLALKVLNQEGCTLNEDLAKQLETYRAMKKGNVAPDILFLMDAIAPAYTKDNFPKNLSAIDADYKLIVFGASWCPKCVQELPELGKIYPKLKENKVEVVFVSLDDDKNTFANFVKIFPFISVCDYQKWEGKVVNDYYVFGTPTMFLLDKKREILLRPTSVKQVEAWVDWYLVRKG